MNGMTQCCSVLQVCTVQCSVVLQSPDCCSTSTMCGIFAYLNHLTPKTRKEILDLLIKGLQRLEYRGYDSAGVGVDGPTGNANISV